MLFNPLMLAFDHTPPVFVLSHYRWSGMERCKVFPARCPVANTCQALPSGNLRLHQARVTMAATHLNATRLCAALVWTRGSGGWKENASEAPAVIVFLWKSNWLTNHMFLTPISCHWVDVFDVAGCCYCCCFVFVFFTLQKEKKVLFCKICATTSEVFWGIWQFATFR